MLLMVAAISMSDFGRGGGGGVGFVFRDELAFGSNLGEPLNRGEPFGEPSGDFTGVISIPDDLARTMLPADNEVILVPLLLLPPPLHIMQ